jgi:drug/metabolite transporter (DMT)-like permease
MKDTSKSAILAFTTVFLWSSAFPLTKVATEYIDPNQLGLLRCTIAAVILLIIGRICNIKPPKKVKHVPLFFLSGGLGFSMYMITFNTGMLTLSSAMGSLIIATTPVLTAIGATFLYKEKIKPIGWVAIGGAFAGVCVLLMWGSDVSYSEGIWWTCGAAFVFCCYNLLNRKLLSMGYNAVECVTWSMTCGAILLLPFAADAINQASNATIPALLVVLYLGSMPSATAYLLWSKAFALAKKTSDVTNYQFLTPLISTLLGLVILSEVPEISTIVGGIIIIISVVAFGLKGK